MLISVVELLPHVDPGSYRIGPEPFAGRRSYDTTKSSFSFYRAMHFSAKRGIAIVILSVRLSVCYVRAL